MFNSGDIVIFYDNVIMETPSERYIADYDLTPGKKYTVLFRKISGYLSIIDDNNVQNTFHPNVFCTLSEYRDRKLEKLLKKV